MTGPLQSELENGAWRRQYDLLFDRVPCAAFVIDRNFRVIRANDKFRESFGDPEAKFCYEVCKRRRTPCRRCTASLTFSDGCPHTAREVGVHRNGSRAHYMVTSSALSGGQEGIAHSIQMITDVTQIVRLEQELRKTQDFYQGLIQNAPSGMIAIDPCGSVKVINPAARSLLEWTAGQPPTAERLRQMLPEQFFTCNLPPGEKLVLPEAVLRSTQGQEIPARFTAVNLKSGRRKLGRAAFIRDLREIKEL